MIIKSIQLLCLFLIVHLILFCFTGLTLWTPITETDGGRAIVLGFLHLATFIMTAFSAVEDKGFFHK